MSLCLRAVTAATIFIHGTKRMPASLHGGVLTTNAHMGHVRRLGQTNCMGFKDVELVNRQVQHRGLARKIKFTPVGVTEGRTQPFAVPGYTDE